MLTSSRGQPLAGRPHLGHEMMPANTVERAQRWAAEIGCTAYAIDDQSAITVVDGVAEVVSEGQWQRLDS